MYSSKQLQVNQWFTLCVNHARTLMISMMLLQKVTKCSESAWQGPPFSMPAGRSEMWHRRCAVLSIFPLPVFDKYFIWSRFDNRHSH